MSPKLTPEWAALLSLVPGYDSEATADETDYFDEDAAYRAIDFFAELLNLVEGEAKPFVLEPWQAAITASLWGWRRKDGTRRYRECLLYIGRKNGKGPFSAGLALLSLFTDTDDVGRQIYIAASDKGQSSLVFRHCAGMVAKEPELAKRTRTYRSFKTIEYPADGSILKALASDASRLDGLNASMVIIDELHAHKTSELVDVLTTATASRKSPLIIYTTTADFQRPSICNTRYEYACGVRDGKIKDRAFLPVIYEARPDDDWTDPAVWRKANPNLNVSVQETYLERECQRCLVEPSFLNVFQRLHLCIRTGTATHWISAEHWNRCEREMPDLSGRVAYGGMDLSSTLDISAVVLAIPYEDVIWLLPKFYVPESKLDSRQDKVPYRQWHDDGLLIATPGEVIDYEFIRRDINALATEYDLRSLRYDPWNAQDLATRLSETDGIPMLEMRQGYASMSYPTREFERRTVAQSLAHDGNPILAWMLSGCMIVRDASDNLKVHKQKSSTRVDGVIAAIEAIAGAIAEDDRRSVYEHMPVLVM